MPDLKFLQRVVFVSSMVPFALLCWDTTHGRLGANPLEYVTHTTGALTLIFLLLSLAVTPLRKILRLPWIVPFRRTLGLFAFFYGCLHLLCYLWFDKFFNLPAIVHDVARRPFIALGMFSFVLLGPLAITSTKKMIRRLGGKRWNRLHRAIYLAAAAGALHYYLLVKADVRKPLAFAVALALLLAYRLLNSRGARLWRAISERKSPPSGSTTAIER